MLEFLTYLIGTPTWLVGGAYTAKQALAHAEGHYLELAAEAERKDPRLVPQDTMDTDDWIGATLYAAGAFALFPALAVGWAVKRILTKPFRLAKKPVRAFFLPPQQKAYEHHVTQLNNQKELIMSTAKTYRDVCGWEPEDHPDRIAMVKELQDQIKQQMSDLMAMTDPKRASDTAFLDGAKFEVKELTAG